MTEEAGKEFDAWGYIQELNRQEEEDAQQAEQEERESHKTLEDLLSNGQRIATRSTSWRLDVFIADANSRGNQQKTVHVVARCNGCIRHWEEYALYQTTPVYRHNDAETLNTHSYDVHMTKQRAEDIGKYIVRNLDRIDWEVFKVLEKAIWSSQKDGLSYLTRYYGEDEAKSAIEYNDFDVTAYFMQAGEPTYEDDPDFYYIDEEDLYGVTNPREALGIVRNEISQQTALPLETTADHVSGEGSRVPLRTSREIIIYAALVDKLGELWQYSAKFVKDHDYSAESISLLKIDVGFQKLAGKSTPSDKLLTKLLKKQAQSGMQFEPKNLAKMHAAEIMDVQKGLPTLRAKYSRGKRLLNAQPESDKDTDKAR